MNDNNEQNIQPSEMMCEQCNIKMEPMKTQFSYLGRSFGHNVLRCPKCGLVFVSEELASGRMREVETALEDK